MLPMFKTESQETGKSGYVPMAAKRLGKMPLKSPAWKEANEDDFWGENDTRVCSPNTLNLVFTVKFERQNSIISINIQL